MTAAAFQGSYADMKFVKSRSVVQIVIELPIERAAAFVAAFGAPEPSKECPVAIARIDTSTASSGAEKPTKRAFNELPIAQRSAMLCEREAFRTFLNQQRLCNVTNAEDAASALRGLLSIRSRADLGTNIVAATKFEALEREFNDWLMEPV